MTKNVFLLGLGAQKAGTTWIYKYLENSGELIPGVTKEYHIWDRRESELFRTNRLSHTNVRKYNVPYLWLMEKFPSLYFRHFTNLLKKGGIATDITPSYSSVSQKSLERIRDTFEKQGVEVEVAFLMRDPIQRCISAVKMNRGHGRAIESISLEGDINSAVAEYYASDHATLRTRYEDTVKRMDAVFRPEQIFLGFYEDLFTEAEVRRFSDFMDVPYKPEFTKERVNVARVSYDSDSVLEKKIFEFYRPTYEFCAERFPKARDLWYGWREFG